MITMQMQFPRQIGLKRSMCYSQREFDKYLSVLGSKSSCYTSLYAFTKLNPDNRPDYSTALIDRAWWDFDLGKNGVQMPEVKDDVALLIRRIYEDYPDSDVRVVATGRGFHVHQMFSQTVSGVHWSAELQRYEAKMAEGLRSLDGIGYAEKLTRIPNTYNPSRKRWAVMIDTHEFMKNPHDYSIPSHPSEAPKDYCPFLGIPVASMAFNLVDWVNTHPKQTKPVERICGAFSVGLAGEVPLPPCINSTIKQPNPEHQARIFLVTEMAHNMRWFADPDTISDEQQQEIEDSICSYIETLNWIDYNASITRKAVRSLIRLKNPPSCRVIQRRGWCKGSCWRDDGTMEV